jgi:predicted transcriptional regulator
MTVEIRLVGPEGTETREFDEEAADRLCRPTSIELLRALVREGPTSIREAARLVDRDVRQVHDNLWKLGELGLVEFDRSGQSHRPYVTYERIELEIDL